MKIKTKYSIGQMLYILDRGNKERKPRYFEYRVKEILICGFLGKPLIKYHIGENYISESILEYIAFDDKKILEERIERIEMENEILLN